MRGDRSLSNSSPIIGIRLPFASILVCLLALLQTAYACVEGKYVVALICVACPAGTLRGSLHGKEGPCVRLLRRGIVSPMIPGSYCTGNNKYDCPAGAWCEDSCIAGDVVGCSRVVPPEGSGPCPIGAYCPGATAVQSGIACPGGKYANVTGLSVCNNCPSGKYSPTTAATACLSCPPGTL
jgi:hypothetical protein